MTKMLGFYETPISIARNPLGKRFGDALGIQNPGACNPSGIAISLVAAISECKQYGINDRTDSAVRLICHQLAYILGVDEINSGLDTYSQLTKACELGAAQYEESRK